MNDSTVIVQAPDPGRRYPEKVGKYRIDGILGEGAMGVVYRGHDPDIDRVVAIKTIHAHLIRSSGGNEAGSEDWLERFAREARAAGRCLHANLVTIFDYLQQDGAPYIVMEYVDARTLEDRIKNDALPGLAEVGRVMNQVLMGLSAIHGVGIVHRDMKPANVMLTADGMVKLADFGVARFDKLEATGGGMIGTPSYMSPEQFSGGEIDHRADIYACGAVLYELVSGRKPFIANGLPALMQKVLAGDPPPLTDQATGVPEELDRIVRKALAAKPEERFQSASSFRVALNTCLEGMVEGSEKRDRLAAPVTEITGVGTTMIERLSQNSLARIEAELVSQIGPMGRVLARRSAQSSTDVNKMIELLVAEVKDLDVSETLRRRLVSVIEETGPSVDASGAPVMISADVRELMIRALTPYVGPIAKVLVKRAAAKARSVADLRDALASEISSETDRAEFLRNTG